MIRSIVLCADDFGQASPISEAIVVLIQNQRLSATSCMVNSPYWAEHATDLKPLKHAVDIGLHFNLTEGHALSSQYIARYGREFPALNRVLMKAFLHQIDRSTIEAECHAQLDRFSETMGFLPQFLDGHQHVHQFPIIREAVINIYKQRLSHTGAYIRSTDEKNGLFALLPHFKKLLIYLSGTQSFKKRLMEEKIPHNQSFAGIYNFSQAENYANFFQEFLNKIEHRGVIMCHPGLPSEGKDSIAAARYQEYLYLRSDDFVMACKSNNVAVSRFL